MKIEKNSRVSLKTIADQAGLSVSTVSQILNNKPCNFSSEITKNKVRQIANAVSYHPNFGYKLMRGEKSKTVALLISSTKLKSYEYAKDMIISLIEQFDQQGYACYLVDFTGDAATNYSKVLELISRGVDHFVFLGPPHGHDRIGELIKSRGKKYVVFGGSEFLDRYVESDSASGAAAIIRFFLSRGITNFRLLMTPLNGADFLTNSRICGLMAALPDVDVETLRRYVFEMESIDINENNCSELYFKIGYDATAKLLEKDPNVQAIFYKSDFFAVGGAKFLHERGRVIGKDILLAGFNDTSVVKKHIYPISSVEHDICRITKAIITESLKEENSPFNVKVPTIVHIRE